MKLVVVPAHKQNGAAWFRRSRDFCAEEDDETAAV
jgi:hypothetical protein